MKESRTMRWLCSLAARRYLHRPDQAEIIRIKYPTFGDLPAAALNEAAFRIGLSRSFRLTALNVELTNRCNLSCSICPRREQGGRPESDMDLGTFKSILDATPGLRILLPYQWGEPLLSPVLLPAIEYAHTKGVRVMLTTNGTLLDKEMSRDLLRSGLERLTVSFDGDFRSHSAIRGVDSGTVFDNIRLFRELRDSLSSRCALDVSMVVDEKTEPYMREFEQLFSGTADRLQFVPRFIEAPRSNACRELWRGVLVVLSNGDVTVCCADPLGRGILGNIAEAMPREWFNSRQMRLFRKRHVSGNLPPLCAGCSEYRSPSVSPRFS